MGMEDVHFHVWYEDYKRSSIILMFDLYSIKKLFNFPMKKACKNSRACCKNSLTQEGLQFTTILWNQQSENASLIEIQNLVLNSINTSFKSDGGVDIEAETRGSILSPKLTQPILTPISS